MAGGVASRPAGLHAVLSGAIGVGVSQPEGREGYACGHADEGAVGAVSAVRLSAHPATILFVAVDDLEPNRRYALAFKFLPRLYECCGNRTKTDALTAVRLRHNERALSAK